VPADIALPARMGFAMLLLDLKTLDTVGFAAVLKTLVLKTLVGVGVDALKAKGGKCVEALSTEEDVEASGLFADSLVTACPVAIGVLLEVAVVSGTDTDGFLRDKENLTFSPSLRTSSAGGGGDEPLLSPFASSCRAAARSICSAISSRSLCSSDLFKRSFFKFASYKTCQATSRAIKERGYLLPLQEPLENYRSRL
jgi:hypothetical protein